MASGPCDESVLRLAGLLEEIGKTTIAHGRVCPGLTMASAWRFQREYREQQAKQQRRGNSPPTATLLRAYTRYMLSLEELLQTCNDLQLVPQPVALADRGRQLRVGAPDARDRL